MVKTEICGGKISQPEVKPREDVRGIILLFPSFLSLPPPAGIPHWLKPVREYGYWVVLTFYIGCWRAESGSEGQMEDIQLTGLRVGKWPKNETMRHTGKSCGCFWKIFSSQTVTGRRLFPFLPAQDAVERMWCTWTSEATFWPWGDCKENCKPSWDQGVTKVLKSERVSHSVVMDSLWPYGLTVARQAPLLRGFPRQVGVCCHSVLQGSNPGLLHCR